MEDGYMFIYDNPNPKGNLVGDCVVRAISIATGKPWEDTYIDLAIQGYMMGDMPSSNHVWGCYLKDNGYQQNILPEFYTVKHFCEDYPEGTFILATGTHVVAVKNGDYYDAWDSGDETPIFYWQSEV